MALASPVETAVLVAARIAAVLLVQPHGYAVFGRRWVLVAFAVATLTAATFAPLYAGEWSTSVNHVKAADWVVGVLVEASFGALLGALVSVPAYALLGASNTFATLLRMAPKPLVVMCACMALAAAFAVEVHHGVFIAVRDVHGRWPVGHPERWLADIVSVQQLARTCASWLMLAWTLVTPAWLVKLVLQLVLLAVGTGPSGSRALTELFGECVATLAAVLVFAAMWSTYPLPWAESVGLAEFSREK